MKVRCDRGRLLQPHFTCSDYNLYGDVLPHWISYDNRMLKLNKLLNNERRNQRVM